MPEKMSLRKKGARALRRRVNIEGLEPRVLLSSVVVTSLSDTDTPGTLRNAINTSAAGDVITFDASLFSGGPQVMQLSGQQLDVAHNLTIQGPGANELTLDAGKTSRIVVVDGNVTASISGVALVNGSTTTSGGAIDAEGSLTLSDSSISNSAATGANGGAIYAGFGTLTLNNDTITGNSASNGGGIYGSSSAAVVVNNSTISNNLAPGGSGGGINAQGTLTLNNSTVSGNSVAKTGSSVQAGGGLALAGYTVVINESTISGNSADGGLGGGIYATENGQLTLTNSTVYGNTAAGANSKGGGIYNTGFSNLLVENGTIAANTSGRGGGLYLARGDTSIYNTIVAQNTATVAGGLNDISGSLDYDYPSLSPGTPVGPQASSNNLIDDAASAGGLADATSGNIVGHPALLGSLGANGGPTSTVLPQAGSPAIDAGSNDLANDYSGATPVALTTDQRGFQRISNGTVDIGAVEVAPSLGAPTNLVATGGADEVKLAWDPVSGASGYAIFRGTTPGGESTTALTTVPSPGYLDTAVTAGTTYYYTVEAVSGPLTSAPSQEAFATPVLPVINANPAGDTITLTLDADGIHVDWTDLATSGQIRINDPIGLTINGQGGVDTITLSGTGVPLPGVLKLNSAGGNFTLNGLPSTGDPLAGKTLDLGTSTLYVSYSGNSPEPMLQQYLKHGLGLAADSIGSSAANSVYGIGYADSAETSSPNTHPNTVELKYTVNGDANLDGSVNLSDFLLLARHFGQTTSTWLSGDFNYDGTTSLSDLLVLTRNFGKSVPPPPAAALSFASNPTSGPLAVRRR